MEGGKNSRAAPGCDSRCKKRMAKCGTDFMDHERKSEKKITNKKKQGLVPTTGTDCSR